MTTENRLAAAQRAAEAAAHKLRKADLELCMQLHEEYYRVLGRVLLSAECVPPDTRRVILEGRGKALAAIKRLSNVLDCIVNPEGV